MHNHCFAKRLTHDTHAKNSGVNTFHVYRVTTSLTLSVSTKLGHNMRTSSPSLHRPQTSVCFFLIAKLLDTHNRHPRVSILLVSNWLVCTILIGCASVSLVWSNQAISITHVVLFFTPGYKLWSYLPCQFNWLLIGSLQTHCSLSQSKRLYHPRCLNLLKQIFLVVVGGGGGGGGGW